MPDPDMTILFYLLTPLPSGRGFECNRIFTKGGDSIGAASNITGGQVWRSVTVPVTVSSPAGDVVVDQTTWNKHYETPPEVRP
jgi:hypothetical protein